MTSYIYTISSSASPLAPSFTNLTMTLVDGNQYTERFTFNFTMHNAVVPSAPLNGVAEDQETLCWFNSTLVSATIWTRMRATYPSGIGDVEAAVNATNVFAPWPFAVEVRQVEEGTPTCRDLDGRVVGGDMSPDGIQGGQCGCWYANHGLSTLGGGNGTEAVGSRKLFG